MNRSVWLKNDDLCAILTIDGQFAGIWADSEKQYLENADAITECMIFVLNEEEWDGSWLWKIKKNGLDVTAQYIGH